MAIFYNECEACTTFDYCSNVLLPCHAAEYNVKTLAVGDLSEAISYHGMDSFAKVKDFSEETIILFNV